MNYFVCHTSQATVLKNLAEKSLSSTGLASKAITKKSWACMRPVTHLKLGSGQAIAVSGALCFSEPEVLVHLITKS